MKRTTIIISTLLLLSSARAATFTVINTNDTGAGSLRAAISNANLTATLDTIDFNITVPASGVRTIMPATALPTIFSPIIIDGYSQTGASPNTLTNADNAVLLI